MTSGMRRAAVSSSVLGFVLSIGCSGAERLAPRAGVTGVYALQSINGVPIPAVLGSNPLGTMEVLSEYYKLEADGTYSFAQQYRATDMRGTTTGSIARSGTYAVLPDTIAFTFIDRGSSYTTAAERQGEQLIIRFIAQGTTLTYLRRD